MENRAKITIIDTRTQEETVIPLTLSIEVTTMLVKDAMKNGFNVIVETILVETITN